MFKFILFAILFIYVAYKVSGFILKVFDTMLGRNPADDARQRNFGPEYRRQKYRQPKNGNVNIDYIPEEEDDQKPRPSKGFKGGDYVDYEELK